MSSKRYAGLGVVPFPLPVDILQALRAFAESEHLLEKISSILTFAHASDSKY